MYDKLAIKLEGLADKMAAVIASTSVENNWEVQLARKLLSPKRKVLGNWRNYFSEEQEAGGMVSEGNIGTYVPRL